MLNLDMTGWVQEKMEGVLAAVAHIADIAKDPETPDWYKRNLRQQVAPAFNSGLKVLLWAHDRLDDWNSDMARQPTEHGTMGLAALLNSLGISHQLVTGQPAVAIDDDADREPPNPPGTPQKSENPWDSALRHGVLKHAFITLADSGRRLSEHETRLLAWIAYNVTTSSYEDIALMIEDLLASDVGLAKEQGDAALRSLIDSGMVEVVRELQGLEPRRLPLRIVVQGLNDQRHETPVH